MRKLIIIGLDGASYPYIVRHLDVLPNLARMLADNFGGLLTCDARPMHSGPCWATMFCGDSLGLTDFAQGQDAEAILQRGAWLWRFGDSRQVQVFGVPVTLPPIHINADERGWVATTLAITADEMRQSTWNRSAQLSLAVRRAGVRLVISVWPALDRAGHIFGMDAWETADQYQSIDVQLGILRPMIERHDWVIVSDHGMCGPERKRAADWGAVFDDGRKGRHAPEGLILSNVPGTPGLLSEVYGWLLPIVQMQAEVR